MSVGAQRVFWKIVDHLNDSPERRFAALRYDAQTNTPTPVGAGWFSRYDRAAQAVAEDRSAVLAAGSAIEMFPVESTVARF